MATVLDEIIAHKHQEVLQKKQAIPLSELERHLSPLDRPVFELALRANLPHRKGLILEVKPASPSAGTLAPALDLEGTLTVYNRYASAISVLTDRKYFQGSLDLLRLIRRQTDRPLLCKDFVVDPYQVVEARVAGAHAVLLIVKVLEDTQLKSLYEQIVSLGMTAVVEVQNETELSRALALSPAVLLINNRNLSTFAIDFGTTHRLSSQIPRDILRIAASGIENRYDIEQLSPDCDAFLIGSVLMRTSLDRLPDKLMELAMP